MQKMIYIAKEHEALFDRAAKAMDVRSLSSAITEALKEVVGRIEMDVQGDKPMSKNPFIFQNAYPEGTPENQRFPVELSVYLTGGDKYRQYYNFTVQPDEQLVLPPEAKIVRETKLPIRRSADKD